MWVSSPIYYGKIVSEKKLENIKENTDLKNCQIQKFLQGSWKKCLII